MLDIKFVRENPDAVKENIRKKFQDAKLPLVDEVIALDAQYRKCLQEAENLKAQRNKLSKANGPLFGQLKKCTDEARKAEQNKVWVGLSKETAHQLGTPISSLMAWVELLKVQYPNDTLIPSMSEDVERLQMIANRFSKIGSAPELKAVDLRMLLEHVVEYMRHRTSDKVRIVMRMPDNLPKVRLSVELFEWVIENLCKNAVDAMNGVGCLTISVEEGVKYWYIDVSDTGKGIDKRHFEDVFAPGYTTKKRGWGLGLSWARRIVMEYHSGRIFVKQSELNRGTTFRIELKK